MEVSAKRYLRRRQYQRVDINGDDAKVVRLGGKRKRTWKIKEFRKLKLGFRFGSPIKFFIKLRDGYINMMLGLSGNVNDSHSFFGNKRIPTARRSVRNRKISKAEEMDVKLILEIYKALKASQELTSG
ncbi:hypothetical protein ACHQM5_005626 [Ranunculus cassubicifolius]